MATPSSILGLENSMDRRAWQAIVYGVAELDITDHAYTHSLLHSKRNEPFGVSEGGCSRQRNSRYQRC